MQCSSILSVPLWKSSLSNANCVNRPTFRFVGMKAPSLVVCSSTAIAIVVIYLCAWHSEWQSRFASGFLKDVQSCSNVFQSWDLDNCLADILGKVENLFLLLRSDFHPAVLTWLWRCICYHEKHFKDPTSLHTSLFLMIPRLKRIPVAAFILISISLPSKSSWYFRNLSTSVWCKMDTYHTYDSVHLKKKKVFLWVMAVYRNYPNGLKQ